MPSVKTAHAGRLAAFSKSINENNGEAWVAAMAVLLIDERYFRFLDSGDLNSVAMLDCFVRVAKRVPDCKFWIPTREYSIVSEWIDKHGELPDNVVIRLSGLMVDGPAPTRLAKRLGVLTSRVVSDGSYTCPSLDQGNECGTCRACWDKEKACIAYQKH